MGAKQFFCSSLFTAFLLSIFFLLFAFLFSACTMVEPSPINYPKATNYVVDTSNVISDDLEISLDKNLADFKDTAQIAVVTVPTTYPLDEKQYAINLAREWGIGDAEKDNGVLFLIVTDDRRVRIETGRGVEGVITDSEAGRILDKSVIPFLKNNDWEGGIKSGITAIMEGVKQ